MIEKYSLNNIILVSRFHSALIFMFESFFDVTIPIVFSHGQFAEFLINFRYTNILDLAFDLGMLAVIGVDTSVAFLIKKTRFRNHRFSTLQSILIVNKKNLTRPNRF